MSNLFSPSGQQQAAKATKKFTPGAPASPVLGPPAPAHPALEPVTGPPQPVFQAAGSPTPMTTDEFNQRLAAFTAQHVAATGVHPSPAAALAAVVNPDMPPPVAHPALTAAQAALAAHPVQDTADFVQQLQDAAKTGESAYNQFVVQNSGRIHDLQTDPVWKTRVNGIVAGAVSRFSAASQPGGYPTVQEALGTSERQLSPKEAAFFNYQGATGVLGTAVKQIVTSLVFSPYGLYLAGKGASEDVGAATQGNFSFQHTRALGAGMAHQTVLDFQHPGDRAGFLFLDLLGAASVGAGSVARIAEAGRTGELGALLRKPPLQTHEIHVGGYTENVPLSSNPLVAHLQKQILSRRQALVDQAARGVQTPQSIAAVYSFQRKVGREADARIRVERNAMMAPEQELRVVAGTAAATSRILGRLGPRLLRGLSLGEQKAIQAMSWDVDGGLPEKIAAERKFHEDAILNADTWAPELGLPENEFVRNHERHLGALAAAEKAIENPSARFTKALDRTAALMAENDRLRIEHLGLAPLTAEGRIAKAGQVLRGEPVEGGARASESSFYLPTQPKGKTKVAPRNPRGVSAGPYGTPPPRMPPELNHEFTGDAMRAGDYRIDATNLAAETYARTVRAVTTVNQWKKLWDGASEDARAIDPRFRLAVRDTNVIPDKLRALVSAIDEGTLSAREADALGEDLRDLIRELFPDPAKVTPEEMDHIRWVDSRLVSGRNAPINIGHAAENILNTLNNPFRFATLYLRPAYLLNAVGNQFMLALDQGIFTSFQNVARAMALGKTDGEANAAAIHRLVGAGRAHSYHNESTGLLLSGKVTRATADFWARITDRDERAAAWVYYADRKGYKTAADRDRLLHDAAAKADLTEVTRRANKSLVEFDNLTEFEKNIMRHLIFVYPWVRGSTVWTLRAIMEHPAKMAILAKLGEQAIEHDPWLKGAPAWFKRVGYIPVGWNHHNQPMVVNPTSINTPSTLMDLMSVAEALTTRGGNKTAGAEDLLGPAGKFAVHAVTGRDEYGNKYPDGAAFGALRDQVLGLPQLAALGIGKKKHPSAAGNAPFDIRHRETLQRHADAALKQVIFGPSFWNGFGQIITGGLAPRPLNPAALRARGATELTAAQRLKRELWFLNRALTLQGDFLKQPVPPEFRKALKVAQVISLANAQFHKETGRPHTDKERYRLWVDGLEKTGMISSSDAAAERKKLEPLDADHMNDWRKAFMQKYAAADKLGQWDKDVRAVYSFRHEPFDLKAKELHAVGLAPQPSYANRKQDDLTEYGRGYVKYKAHIREMKADGKSALEVRAYQDAHSAPVNGLPSYAALDWADKTPAEQVAAVTHAALHSWSSLSLVDKQILGRKTTTDVSQAWAAYTAGLATGRQSLPAGSRSISTADKLRYARIIDSHYGLNGAFYKDVLFAQEPLYQRLKMLRPIQESPNKADWAAVFKTAGEAYTYMRDSQGTYSKTRLHDDWLTYVHSQGFLDWLHQHPGFERELGAYGRHPEDVLARLVN